MNNDTGDVTVETYIIGCTADLYDARIAVSLYRYLRGEIRFPSLDALSRQIGHDAEETARYFAKKDQSNGKTE